MRLDAYSIRIIFILSLCLRLSILFVKTAAAASVLEVFRLRGNTIIMIRGPVVVRPYEPAGGFFFFPRFVFSYSIRRRDYGRSL